METVNAGPRMDRLPVCGFHIRVLILISMGVFFDSFDNTMSGSVLGALLADGWSTLELNSFYLSATFAGLTIGAAASGFLGDYLGRDFAYQFNLALFGVLCLASAFVPDMYWLIALRFVMSIGMGAEYVMGYGMVMEFMPAAQRGKFLGWFAVFAGAGVFATSLVSTLVIPHFGWRWMLVIGGVGTLCVWWARRSLVESPRWLESVGRLDEAEAILKAVEHEASLKTGKPLPEPDLTYSVESEKRVVPVSVLFSAPVIRRTLLAIAIAVVGLFGSYSLTNWMPTFLVKQGMGITKSLTFNMIMMAGYMCGSLLCVFVGDRLGRRMSLVVFGILIAVFGAVYPLATTGTFVLIVGFLLTGFVGLFLFMGLGFVSEIFPTQYRFRGSGLAQMCGRIVLIFSPFIILSLFDQFGIGGVTVFIAVAYIALALVILFFGVETNQKSLEAIAPPVTVRD